MIRRSRTTVSVSIAAVVAAVLTGAAPALAQEPATRQQAIEQAEQEKSQHLTPQEPNKAEAYVDRVMGLLEGGGLSWHPFFQSAYSGGGFTLGAGFGHYVSPYNTIDFRGSYTIKGYKRIESEFVAPHLFKRRGVLSVLGGWREATAVGFFGLGTNTTLDNESSYSFQQPYLATTLTLKPTRRYLTVIGGLEYSQWKQAPSKGEQPSVEDVYTPDNLPGLGASPTYLHSQATVGFDWRTSPGYSRRGGFYGVTGHDYTDRDGLFGFQQLDYEAIQHVPILREAWVLSFRGLASTTHTKDGQEIPFFMLPSVGGGSSLRGFSSWRFRDRSSMLLQAEWRIMVNRFLDTAVFYDTGKVTRSPRDFDFDNLKSDVGFGVRFHGPFATPLRVEIAHSNEGTSLVFSSSAAF